MPKEKPKKLAPKKVGEKKVEKHIHHPPVHDENGKVIEEARDEVIVEIVDDIQMVYQKMTQEEIAELKKQQQEEQQQDLPHVPTLEERVTELERIVAELTEKPKPKPKP